MKTPLALLAVVVAVSAQADAFSELRRFAGPSAADMAKVAVPAPVLTAAAEPSKAPPAVIRATSTQWNDKFPVSKDAIKKIGLKVGTKDFHKWSCEYTEGAASARCDYAYDVWPEMCWYGNDHVVADIDLKDASKATVVSREWRAD